MMRIVRAAGNIVIVVVTLVAVAFAGLSLLSRGDPTNADTWAMGYRPFVVLSGSMEPRIHVGSVLLSRRVDPAVVNDGDVITFVTPSMQEAGAAADPDSLTTHRVVNVTQAGGKPSFTTRGDANEDIDPWIVPAESVLGREVVSVPYFGYVSRFASTKTGLLALIVCPALLLIGMEIVTMVRGRSRKDVPEAAEEHP